MNTPAEILRDFMKVITEVCGPTTDQLLPIFRQNVPPLKITARDADSFQRLCKSLELDSQLFEQVLERRRAYACLYATVYARDIFKDLTNTDFMGDEKACELHFKLAQLASDVKDTIEHCEKCILIAPGVDKPYLIAAESQANEGNFVAASLYMFKMFDKAEFDKFTLFCHLMVTSRYLANVTDPADIKNLKPYSKPSPFNALGHETWMRGLQVLHDQKDFAAFALLTTGNCGVVFEPPTYIHKLADVPGIRYQWLDIGRLLKHLRDTTGIVRSWHLRLADFVVKRGADVLSISQTFSQPLLVIATTLSVEGEVPSFLDLVWDRLDCREFDKTDRQNNTPLHAFVKSPHWKTSRMAKITLKNLLAKGCLALEKDLRGKMPHEYLPPAHQFHKLLLNTTQSPEEGLILRLEEIRKRSNEALNSNDLDSALEGYKMAARIAEKYPRCLKDEKAVLYSNMAAVHLKNGDAKEALVAIEKSLRNNAGFVKSYLRQGQAFSKLKKYADACTSFRRGFDATANQQEKFKFCMEAVNHVAKLSVERAAPVLSEMKPMLVSVWPETLRRLSADGNWTAVNLLVCGPPKFKNTGNMGIVADFMCQTADLKTISQLRSKPNFDMGTLLVTLLERSADFESLAESEGDTAFHALARLCVREVVPWAIFGNVYDLLLSTNPERKLEPGLDGEKRSLLHTVCVESQNLPDNSQHPAVSLTVLLSLSDQLGWNLDLNLRDKHSRRPIDYCRPGSHAHKLLKHISDFQKAESSSRDKASARSGSAPKPKPQQTSPSSSWQDLKALGRRAYSNDDYRQALDYYQQARGKLERDLLDSGKDLKNLPQDQSHDLAILYGNCAECHCHLGNHREFFENAKENVNYDGLWYKGHYRVARACVFIDKPKLAVQAFINSYNHLKPEEAKLEVQTDILRLLTDAAFLLKAPKNQTDEEEFTQMMKNLNLVPSEARMQLALKFIQEHKIESWKKAEFVFCLDGDRNPVAITEDLSIFCKKDLLSRQGWVCSLILQVTNLKDLIPTLKFYPQDHYLHAAVTLIVSTGASPVKQPDTIVFLKRVIDFANARRELNRQDVHGNTALHCLAQCRGPCEPMRQEVARLLIEQGIDVLVPRKDGNIVMEIISPTDSIVGHVKSATDLAIAIARTQKSNGSSGPSAKPQGPAKQGNTQTQAKSQPNLPTNVNKANPSSSSKPKSETPKDGGTKKKECDDCERYLQNANSWTPRTLANVYKDLVKIVKANHRQDGRHKMFRDESIKRIFKFVKQRDVPEIPDCIINLKAQDYKELVLMAAEDKKWTHLLALVYKFKEQKGRDALSRFAEKIAVGEVIKDANMTEASMEELVKLLVSHGGEKEEALKLSVVMEYWKVALTLLDLDANPTHLTLTEDDTPLHVAVKIALEKEPGNLDFLKKLKQLMDKSSGSHPSLDLSCQDRDGNSLLHLATKCKFSSHALAVVEMLCSWHCPVDLRDHAGYTALDYLKHNDRRAEFLRSATVPTAGAKRKTTVFSENIDKDSIASKLREKAGAMLSKLPDVIVNYIDDEPEDEEEEEEEEEEDKEKSEEEEEDAEDSDDQVYEVSDDEADVDKDMKQDTDDLDIDAKVFDDLLWDVECTEAVWNLLKGSSVVSEKDGKKLKKERLQDGMKKIVVNKIKQLASGDWRPHLQRKVHGVPDSLALHRVHLPGGACILWELAVAFSPRKSQGSSGVQASGDNPAASASGGRIYSEIIRVWSIVLHHSDLQRKVKWIVGSHRRGKDCLVQKKLKGLASSQFSGNSHSTRNPVLYMEHEVCVQREVAASQQRSLCPPASAQKNEFQILKFYSFSSALVAAILSNTSRKIDFPFRVTDLEYEMIHLESVAPILLLGRSGTGKTTCCLYRLWAKFLWYWEKAMEIGEAWLPQRNPALELQASVENEDEDEEGVEASPQASHTMATTPPPPNCEDDTASDKDDEDTDSGSDTDVDTEEEEETEQKDSSPPQEIFTHLHQLFVTKNPKLCSEVEKNFLKLRHASGTLTEHNSADIEPLPNTLQDVEDLAFPLFLTSRQLLLLLDASVEGTPYFARDEDLNLKYEIAGWGTQEDIFTIDPLDPNDWLDSDSDSDDGDKGDDAKGAAATGKKASSRRLKEESHHKFGEQRKRKTYLRRECTFEVFANEVWPKISKKAKIDCHPSLVWTEIMSFIQGSFEALGSEGGFLSLADYLTVGNKRAPNFSGNRSKVYAAFECYRKMKQDHHLFDESDLVFNIFKRLRQMNYYQPWILHEIYVDETQDFTQAELALLMCLCQDPNTMFLAGDTAQAIMRGISFRFKDLSSLFYFAAKSVDTGLRGRQNIVKVPDKVHQLRYNYRSHSGILSLASSVLDILHRFFPESFDRLHRDQGMFPGPKPVVIESCSSEDLALLLSGNQRESSHIEFGAHQAILVTNEESKAQLPEVLSAGLVLTIYEAKGLEFDDVLLYNFFADSPAGKEWRIVTEYLDDLATESSTSGGNNVIEIDSGILELPNRPRPLTFDPDQHKILSSELKHLYTAITRARVNVWIFDKDPGSRGPIFEYFKARKLVQCMDAQEDASSENFIFAQKSTAQQWRKSGDQFMSQKQFALAAKCFKHAGHQDREKLALAYQSATEASKLRAKPREMCHLYLKAGAQFVWCGDLRRAALCFQNAREHKLSALAYEKHGELETASKQYLFVPSPQEASHCLEQAGMFRKAIAVLEDSHFYDRAIDCLRRYQIKVERVESERGYVPRVLVDNRPKESQSEDNLCHRAANHHHSNKDFGRAEAAIIRLKNPSDQIVFLERNGYLEKAAELLREEGSTEKAATLMLKAGKMDRALSFAKAGFHKALEASICLAMARRKLCEDEENKEEAKFYAEEARSKFKDLGHFDGQAQARLFLGLLSQDEEDSRKFLAEAYRRFRDEVKPRHNLGEAECLLAIYHQSSENPEIKFNIEHIKTVFKALQNMIAFKLEGTPASFYGLDLHETALGEKVVFWYPAAFPRCREILGRVKKKELHEPSQGLSVDVNTATTVLMQRILSGIEPWAKQTRHELSSKVDELCDKLREDTSALNYLDHLLHLFEFDDCWMREWERLQTGEVGLQSKFSRGLLEDKESRNRALAQTLMDLLLPDSPPAWRSDGDSTRKLVMRVHRCRPALSQIQRLLRHEWNTQGRVGRGRSEDVFKERCKSTDWVVRAGLFSSLLPIWDDVGVQREVKGVERKLNEDFDRYVEWTKKSSKYALFQPKQTKNGYVIEHLSSRFVECLNNLICQQDPVDALYDFSKMLTVLGNRAMIEMMPGPKHLVFWLEVFLSTAWFVIGNAIPKEQRKPFYMSTTLAASVEVVNTCILNNNKEFWTVQQMATDSKVNRKASAIFNDRANYFIGFLAGDSRFSKFSLLGQVTRLCSAAGEENVDPVAERILVLSVVVLLNIPMGFVHESNEHLIRREFAKLSQAQGLPLKLKLLVNQVHEATTYDQVATATISYLSSQYHDTAEQPYLRSCEWHGRSTCPMMWSPLEAGNYATGINLTPLEKVSDTEPYTNEASSPAQEYEEEESAEDQRKLEAKSESLKVETREAWEPGAQEGRPEGEGEELSSEVDALFEKFSQITDTECDICDQDFSEARPAVSGNAGAAVSAPVSSDIPLPTQSNVNDSDLRSQHLKSHGHIEKMHQFDTFKRCYTKEIHDQLEEIKAFKLMAISKLGSSNVWASSMTLLIEDAVLTFEKTRFQLLTQRSWDKVQDLKLAFLDVTKAFEGNKRAIETKIKEQDDQEKEALAHHERMTDGFEEGIDHMDPTDAPVAAKTDGKGRGRRHGRGKFEKNLPPRFQKLQQRQSWGK